MVRLHIHWQHYIFRCRKRVINSRRVEELLHKVTEQLHAVFQLCSRHFEDSQFMNAKQKNRLVHDAVPTLVNIPNPPPPKKLRWGENFPITQVLSHTVAAGIFTLCQLGKLPEETEATAEFLEFIYQLLNTFNSISIHRKQKFGHSMSSTSGHIDFLSSAMDFLNDLTLSKENTIYCVTGWKISTRALLCWWLDLHIRSTKH